MTGPDARIVLTEARVETAVIQGEHHLKDALEELLVATQVLAVLPGQEGRARQLIHVISRVERAQEALRAVQAPSPNAGTREPDPTTTRTERT